MEVAATMTRVEAARRLGISPRQLDILRVEGRGPRFYQVSDAPNSPLRYPSIEFDRWEAEQVQATMARHSRAS